jgi:hypothetical protein
VNDVYPRGVGGWGVPILTLILNIPGWLALKKTVLNRTYAHIWETENCSESASWRVGKSAGQLDGAYGAEFHLLLLWTFVRIRLQLPGKNRANGMRGLQTFLRAGS